jgi:hypothetical protein
MTFPMTQLTIPGTLPVTLLKRAAALTAATGLAAGLAASGSDNDGGDGSSGGTDFSAFTATAESAGYTCAELGDTEEPTTGLKNGLSCMPAADKIGTDPMFTLFGTDDVASGKDAAQKAVEKAGGAGGAAEGLDEAVQRNMFAAVDGDGLAGFCIDQDDNCARVLPGMKLTVAKLDGAMGAEENTRQKQEEEQREADEKQRASEEAEAKATEEAQKYTGWKNTDEAVTQMEAWGIHCSGPQEDEGFTGADCGAGDNMLIFGNHGKMVDKLKKESEIGDDDASKFSHVSDGNWTMVCFPDTPDDCRTVADRTGQKVEPGL